MQVAGDLGDDLGGLLPSGPGFLDAPGEASALHQVEDNEAVIALMAHVMHGDDAVVLQAGDPACLADALQGRHLHGDGPLEGRVRWRKRLSR
jgi:hypothetical protein